MDFATPDAKTLAVTLSENPLDGRKLLIKDGREVHVCLVLPKFTQYSIGGDFTGRPAATVQPDTEENAESPSNLTGHSKTAQKILKSQKQPAGPTLFLGNLGFETTEEAIRDLFTRNRVQKVEDDKPAEEKEVPKKEVWIRKIRMGTFEDTGKCKGYVAALSALIKCC